MTERQKVESQAVLVGQSFFLRFDAKSWQGQQPYPPLGSLIAAACLRREDYEVSFFDAMLAESEDDWCQALDRAKPRFALLFEDNFNYLSKMCLLRMRQAALAMIAAAKERGCTVLVCGSDASDQAEQYLGAGADFVLLGEGEGTLVELMATLSGCSPAALDTISGWIGHDAGGIVRRPARPVLDDLDELPFPAWDLIDVDRYREIWLGHHGYFSLNVATTRGCPFHCNWCAKPIWGQTYHSRSAENVVSELALLEEHFAPDEIWFADDILGLKRGWLNELAAELEGRGLEIRFKCQSRVDLLLRDGEIDALRRAGCSIVWVGAESGSQKILDAMDKGTRVEQIDEATRQVQEAGIRVGFFLQFGYPGEEREDIELTLDMVRRCRPDEIGMSVSYALPGTRFYEMVRDQLGAKQNWEDSQDLDMMYRGTYTTAFYRHLYQVLHKEFRMRRTAAKLRALSPVAWRWAHLVRGAKASYHWLSLPFFRRRLDRLANRPNEGLGMLESGMTADDAADPTPQAQPTPEARPS